MTDLSSYSKSKKVCDLYIRSTGTKWENLNKKDSVIVGGAKIGCLIRRNTKKTRIVKSGGGTETDK